MFEFVNDFEMKEELISSIADFDDMVTSSLLGGENIKDSRGNLYVVRPLRWDSIKPCQLSSYRSSDSKRLIYPSQLSYPVYLLKTLSSRK